EYVARPRAVLLQFLQHRLDVRLSFDEPHNADLVSSDQPLDPGCRGFVDAPEYCIRSHHAANRRVTLDDIEWHQLTLRPFAIAVTERRTSREARQRLDWQRTGSIDVHESHRPARLRRHNARQETLGHRYLRRWHRSTIVAQGKHDPAEIAVRRGVEKRRHEAAQPIRGNAVGRDEPDD